MNTISIEIENDLKILNEMSTKMAKYEQKPSVADNHLFQEIYGLPKDKLLKIRDELVQNGLTGSIRILRYVFIEKLLTGKIESSDKIKDVIEEIKKNFKERNTDYFQEYLNKDYEYALKTVINHKNNAFKSWGAYYRYLLPFIYSQEDKEAVWESLKNIINNILIELNINQDYECINQQKIGAQVRSYYGFEGPSNYGTDGAVIMIHPKNIPDHKTAIQLVCYFHNGKIKAGWDIGWSLAKRQDILAQLNLPTKQDLSEVYSFEDIVSELSKVLPMVKQANEKLLEIYQPATEDIIIEKDAEEEEDKDDTLNLFSDDQGQIKQVSTSIESIRIALNIPFNEDYLDRKKYAKVLASLIKDNKNTPPLNIGISAQWGEGKTQLLYLIKEECCHSDLKFIFFDAWQYDDQEHIWAAMIMTFMEECKKNLFFYIKYLRFKFLSIWSYENLFKLITYFGILFFIPTLIPENVTPLKIILNHPIIFAFVFTFIPNSFKYNSLNISDNFLYCLKTPTYKEHLGFKADIKKLIELTLDHLTKNGKRRIVLCIDNLDRCSQDNIVKILDSICQFLVILNNDGSTKNIVTIFAIDDEIIKSAIKHKLYSKYEGKEDIGINTDIKNKVEEYLDKIINIPFKIPSAKFTNNFIEKCIHSSDDIDITTKLIEFLQKDKNYSPRSIRKLINKFIIFKEINRSRGTLNQLAYIFLISNFDKKPGLNMEAYKNEFLKPYEIVEIDEITRNIDTSML